MSQCLVLFVRQKGIAQICTEPLSSLHWLPTRSNGFIYTYPQIMLTYIPAYINTNMLTYIQTYIHA